MSRNVRSLPLVFTAIVFTAMAAYHLEYARKGIDTRDFNVGETPATRYALPDSQGPIIIVAHGFAGSRQLMQAYSLNLARAGYVVIAFDFEGHGRNPVPMSGDVTSIDGTTRLLVDETRRVIAAARQMPGSDQGMALLGHSMATDVLLRAAIAEMEAGRPVDTMVGISMFSQAINSDVPSSLLIINGQWEGRLRAPALAQLQLIDPQAQEGDTAVRGDLVRRVVAAPYVEHVSVLYSATALREVVAWMDMTFDRDSHAAIVRTGYWILLLLLGIVLLFKPLVQWLPESGEPNQALPTYRFVLAVMMPAIITPMLALLPAVEYLPVLVADYLMMHLAVFGAVQLLILRPRLSSALAPAVAGILVLAIWGIVVFGLALDRYAASFLPNEGRLVIIAVLCLGTVVFMIADAVVTGAGRGTFWRRITARAALILSLLGAAAIDPDRLIFLLLILPVLLLFYLVHGLMGRWIAQRCGALAAGIGLGLCLAWALGVSFPLFDAT